MTETSEPNRGELTRAKLLRAARTEFSTHGIGSARVDRIATQAGVNKERIYSYFGSKEGLFAAVVSGALDELAEAVGQPGTDVAAWVGAVHDFHRDRPELLRLLMWEALHVGRDLPLPGEDLRLARYARKVDVLADRLGRRTGPEVATILLCLIALAAWPNAAPGLTRQILGGDDRCPDSAELLREGVVRFAENALRGRTADLSASTPVG